MPGRFRMDISAEKERACLPAGVGVQGGSDFNFGLDLLLALLLHILALLHRSTL
jgi:hypothetical protein